MLDYRQNNKKDQQFEHLELEIERFKSLKIDWSLATLCAGRFFSEEMILGVHIHFFATPFDIIPKTDG